MAARAVRVLSKTGQVVATYSSRERIYAFPTRDFGGPRRRDFAKLNLHLAFFEQPGKDDFFSSLLISDIRKIPLGWFKYPNSLPAASRPRQGIGNWNLWIRFGRDFWAFPIFYRLHPICLFHEYIMSQWHGWVTHP